MTCLVSNELDRSLLVGSRPFRGHEALDTSKLAGIDYDILDGEWDGEEAGDDGIDALESLGDFFCG